MDLSTLTNTPGARKGRKRVGRGRASGMGKTSTRGMNGQGSRKGHKQKIGFEGGQMPLMRRLPKRGFKNPNRLPFYGINVGELEQFDNGSVVDIDILLAAGFGYRAARTAGIKILGDGELTKKLTVKVSAFSATAKAKIEALGGTCEQI
ncbi:MAG: 50S ribosomal protein L15 [Kiritimatiellia bacterium]